MGTFEVAALGFSILLGMLFFSSRTGGFPTAANANGATNAKGGLSLDRNLAPKDAIVLYSGVGGFNEVVGESNYQPAIYRARSSATEIKGRLMFWATIEPEDSNEHDPNAVVIKHRGEKLGYLSRSDAKIFRKSHAEAISRNLPIVLRGIIIGGGKGKPTLGVMLDFYLGDQKTYKKKQPPL